MYKLGCSVFNPANGDCRSQTDFLIFVNIRNGYSGTASNCVRGINLHVRVQHRRTTAVPNKKTVFSARTRHNDVRANQLHFRNKLRDGLNENVFAYFTAGNFGNDGGPVIAIRSCKRNFAVIGSDTVRRDATPIIGLYLNPVRNNTEFVSAVSIHFVRALDNSPRKISRAAFIYVSVSTRMLV